MAIATLVFYLFSIVLVLSALMVITVRNPVYSVLFLILAFFNAAGLFVLLGAEYIAMTLVIVYVGAVAVLFLFVVMMLDINIARFKEGFLDYLGAGLMVAGFFLLELLTAIYASLQHPVARLPATPAPLSINNTRQIGNVLYTDYVFLFQTAGLILLVAMVGAIMLTHRTRPGVRRQKVGAQMARNRGRTVELVSMQPGEGAR